MDDHSIKTTRLQYSDTDNDYVAATPKGEPFLKGPILLPWIQKSAELPGKALNVVLAIRWLSDMNYGQPIKISKKAMESFGFSNDACADALKRLEAAGIVDIERLPGQKPIVTLKF